MCMRSWNKPHNLKGSTSGFRGEMLAFLPSTAFCKWWNQTTLLCFKHYSSTINFRESRSHDLFAWGARAEALPIFIWKWVGHRIIFYKFFCLEGIKSVVRPSVVGRCFWRHSQALLDKSKLEYMTVMEAVKMKNVPNCVYVTWKRLQRPSLKWPSLFEHFY